MELSPELKKKYTKEPLSAREAQRLAEFIAWGPVVFQASRLMVKLGILDLLRESDNGMTREEIESVGLNYCSYDEMVARYPINKLKDGWNTMPDGEEIYYVPNPALGLWINREKFAEG